MKKEVEHVFSRDVFLTVLLYARLALNAYAINTPTDRGKRYYLDAYDTLSDLYDWLDNGDVVRIIPTHNLKVRYK